MPKLAGDVPGGHLLFCARMHRYFLSIRAFFVLAATLAVVVVAGGCGGSDSSSANEVTVQTGSLSKAEFIKRANAICEAVRSRFLREYVAFYEQKKPKLTGAPQGAWLSEVVEAVLLPNYEQRMIGEISVLGAPASEEQEVASFLNSLQQRLDEVHQNPAELTKSPYPFAKPARVAKKYGLTGCAGSFS